LTYTFLDCSFSEQIIIWRKTMTKISVKDLHYGDRAWEADRVIELTDAELEKIRGGMTPTNANAIAMRIIGGGGGGGTGGSGTS
jgi:lactobin A/cerein 7B family class IIb bacteriocin